VKAFVRLGRPLFLGGGFLLFGLGAAIASATGHRIDGTRYVLGQVAVTAFQLMTHYANEYFDLEADRANATPTRWSGGSRVLVAGVLPARVALCAAIVLAALGLAVAAIVAVVAGPASASILIAILVLAWCYSAPPARLCARGLGEVDTALVVTVLVPGLGFYLQAPDLSGGAMFALSIVPPVLLQVAMLLAIEAPDARGDELTGKRTLVVRLGSRHATALYGSLVALAFAWLPVAWILGLPGTVAAVASLPVPFAIWRLAHLREHADRSAHERVAQAGVALLVATSAAELAGWLLH